MTRPTPPRRPLVIVAVLTAGLALAGCSTGLVPSSAPTTAVPSTTSAPSPSASAETLTPYQAPPSSFEPWTVVRPDVLLSHEGDNLGYTSKFDGFTSNSVAAVYSPHFGSAVLDATTLHLTGELLAQQWTIGGSARNSFVGFAEQDIPSQGLTPEHFDTYLITAVVTDGEAVLTPSVRPVASQICRGYVSAIAGSTSSVVVLQFAPAPSADQQGHDCGRNDEDPGSIVGIDITSGATVWSTPNRDLQFAVADRVISRSVVNSPVGIGSVSCDGDQLVDDATGAVLFSLDSRNVPHGGLSDCAALYPSDIAGYAVQEFDGDVNGVGALNYRWTDGQQVSFTIGGHQLAAPDAYDPVTGIGVCQGTSDCGGAGITTFALQSGTVLYTLPEAQAVPVNAGVSGIIAGLLFVGTTNQNLVLDAKTGEILRSDLRMPDDVLVMGAFAELNGTLVKAAGLRAAILALPATT